MSDPPVVITGIRPGITARGLDRDEIPIVDWLCACGHHERATGRQQAQQLLTTVRVGHCPHARQNSGVAA